MSELLTMNPTEIRRLEIVQRLQAKTISQREAAQALGLSERQVRRLQRRFERRGTPGLISARRGKPALNRLSPAVRARAIELVRERYADFGPTYANEKLREQHGLILSTESLRQLLIDAELWKHKRVRRLELHPPRTRRERFGELVQIDGSEHAWFENRGPRCSLLVFIDDATSRVVGLHFDEAETTWGYFTVLQNYLTRFGKPFALYSDRHSIFRVNKPTKAGAAISQLGRALKELRIELICANSPQAKGRVERANGTLQNRLIKEMRLLGISTIHDANAFVPDFIEYYNAHFALPPRDSQDAHRPLDAQENLNRILSFTSERRISKQLTLQYRSTVYFIETKTPRRLQHATATIREAQCGMIVMEHQGEFLTFKAVDEVTRQPIADRKKLETILPQRVWPTPAPNHPWRPHRTTAPQRTYDSDTLAWETPDINALR
jgi:transposase